MNLKMWLFSLSFVTFALTGLTACASTDKVDRRNFAIDTYTPTPNEISLAEQKARIYWEKHRAQEAANTTYLAIQVSKVFPAEIVQNLWPKIINSETTSSFFSKGRTHNPYGDLDLWGVMIFDTHTERFVDKTAYVIVNTPPRGRSARFNNYIARYIGTGR